VSGARDEKSKVHKVHMNWVEKSWKIQGSQGSDE
jgi:hypothetical protein